MAITICDFCDRKLDEDEELTPVFFGEPPKRSATVRGESPSVQDHEMNRYSGPESPDRTMMNHVLCGYRVVHIIALLSAISNTDKMQLHTYDYEMDVSHVDPTMDKPELSPDGGIDHGFETNEKPSIRLDVESGSVDREPALEVCENCHKGISEEGAST